MDFAELLGIVGDEPVFESALLLAGDVNAANVRRQLSRWTRAGRLYQLRRGLYALAPPHRKTRPHPFVVANAMVRGSYVSLQAALAHYGLIPEYTPVVTSVTSVRPGRWTTRLGAFAFRHVKLDWLHGYQLVQVADGQRAFLATPEKALLDLVYLEPGSDTRAYLGELRLANLERLDLGILARVADESGSPKLRRAAQRIIEMTNTWAAEYETL